MTLPSSGPISLSEIAEEFGGSTPHSLGEYYGAASGVPTSGTIDFADFYGTSVPAVVPSSGLIMEMDPSTYSSGSTWNDSAGTNNQMTKYGSPTYTSSSPAHFTTSNFNFWEVTTRPTGNYAAATFIAWIYRTSNESTEGIFDIRYGNGTQFGMELKDNGELGYFWNNNSGGTYGYYPNVYTSEDEWCMVGVGVDSTSAEFFVRNPSGEEINNRTYTHTTQTIGSTSKVYYGNDPEASASRGFEGRLGHFYMYNRKISTAEFRSIYNAEKSYYGH